MLLLEKPLTITSAGYEKASNRVKHPPILQAVASIEKYVTYFTWIVRLPAVVFSLPRSGRSSSLCVMPVNVDLRCMNRWDGWKWR